MSSRFFTIIRGKLSGEFSGRYRIIYLLAVAEAMLCIIFPGQLQIYDHDTWTYLETWGNYDIFRPSTFVDIYRTPVYPLFLGITTLNQQLPMATVVLVQWIVFIASIPFFKRLSFMLVRRKSITFWMTLFYATFWGSIEVNYCLMTESLSQSLIVMFVYFMVRSLLRPGAKSIYCSALCLLILVFLRPAMLYLPVIYIAVCVYIWTRNHREGLRGLLSAAMPITLRVRIGIQSPARIFRHVRCLRLQQLYPLRHLRHQRREVLSAISPAASNHHRLCHRPNNMDERHTALCGPYQGLPRRGHHQYQDPPRQIRLSHRMDVHEFLAMPRQPVSFSLLAYRHDADARHGHSRRDGDDIPYHSRSGNVA